jgi:septal ring factor EnvC (AmiA/AmiB activator)
MSTPPAAVGGALPARMRPRFRILWFLIVAALSGLSCMAATTAGASSLDQLHSQLNTQQARQQSLTASIGSLNHLIASLDSQITLVQNREATLSGELADDRTKLARVQVQLKQERARLVLLRRRLATARLRLSRQLVGSYESAKPDLVSVVLNAHGFNDLLEQIDFLGRAEHAQQSVITATRVAKAQADQAATRLAQLQRTDRQITQATAIQVRAVAGMNALLQSKQGALQSARGAQQSALAASRTRGAALQTQIKHVEAQQAAAEAAARRAAQAPAPSSPNPLGPTGGSGGWAIPYAIVLCESGGQNLPPNSAGASGYYQIIPSTWKLFGGTGPAAYLTSKAEQDAVASRIWRGGAGASNWVCAGIVGIH